MKSRFLIILMCLGCCFLGCKDFGEELQSEDWQFTGVNRPWTLYSLQLNGVPVSIPAGQVFSYSVLFENETSFRAQSHCNSCYGSYRVGLRNAFAVSFLSCTEMLCPPPSVDGEFREALRRVSSYESDEYSLTLWGDNGKTVLRFFYNIR